MNSFTRNSLVMLSIILIVVLGGYIALYMYIGHLRAATGEINGKLVEAENKRNQEVSLKILAKDIAPSLQTLSRFVVSSDDDIAFIKNLEKLASDQSVVLQIVSAAETNQGAFKQISFQVVIEGSWSRVIHFIDLLESMPYKIVIKGTTLNTLDKGVGKWRATLEFTVVKEK